RVSQVERIEHGTHPVDMALVGVVVARYRLVGAAESDEIGGDGAEARAGDHGDHLPVEVRPRRLAVEHEHRRRVARALVDVVHAKRAAVAVGNFDVVRLERIAGQVGESLVGRADELHSLEMTLSWNCPKNVFSDSLSQPNGGTTMRSTPSSAKRFTPSRSMAPPAVTSMASASRPASFAALRISSSSGVRSSVVARPGKKPSPNRPARRAAALV